MEEKRKLPESVQRKHAITFRLTGAGRKVKHDAVEQGVIDFFVIPCSKTLHFKKTDESESKGNLFENGF